MPKVSVPLPGPGRGFFRGVDRVVETTASAGPVPYLVFANWAYREVLLNWLVASARVELTNIVIVAYDRRLERFLRRRGFDCVFLPMKPGKSNLWWRMFVFYALCEAEVDFVHCDADAVLLKNPAESLNEFPSADLVASQGTVHPKNVVDMTGFVVCMGFFLIRSNKRTRAFMKRALERAPHDGTDQSAVNNTLLEWVTVWTGPIDCSSTLEYKGKPFRVFPQALVSRTAEELATVLLPHHLFQRYFLGLEHNPVLVHPLARQHGHTKMKKLSELGLIFLRPDWTNVRFSRDTIRRIDRDSIDF